MARRNAHFRRRFNASGPLERVLILIVLAAAIGVTIGLLLPQVSSDAAKITGGYTATGSAADTLNALAVDDNQSSSGYDRDSFGFRTTDVDGNGCDVRDDVLAKVQIDHVVALENAWQSGARDWSTAKRHEFGNDPYNLLAVDGPANQEKGSASAAYWLPTNADYRCDYVARQIGVKDKYQLTVTSQEKDAMLAVLHTCPGQAVPADE